MKYMLIMRSRAEALEASREMDVEDMLNRMGAYNEALIDSGLLPGGEGLADIDGDGNDFVVDFDRDPPAIVDGPDVQPEERFNGFWILEVPPVGEAVEWASRCPLGPGSQLGVRRLSGVEDFADVADNEFIRKENGCRADQQANRRKPAGQAPAGSASAARRHRALGRVHAGRE